MADVDAGTAPEARKPTGERKQHSQGLQLLPLLIKHYKTALVLLLIYFTGYIGLSATWMLIGYFAYAVNCEYQKIKAAKRAYCQEAAVNEKAAILARVEELPAWVYFPDVERAEWLNKMIKQMWPYIGDYVKKLIKETIEPICENSMPTSLRPFTFDCIDMGDTPPRIGGIKVYTENVRRDEVIMDMELLYAGDAEIKVVARGMPAGIKHLTLHGTVRVIFKPLVPIIPLIGGLNVFFLTSPGVDFDLTNLANLLDIPLLSNSLRTALENIIASYLVLPNKVPIQLVQEIDINKLRFPMPQGIIRIHAVAARELKKADAGLFGKSSDPYCKIYVGAQMFKTNIVKNNLNPVWNKHFEAIVDQKFGQMIEIEVLDDDAGKDDDLGTASINIETIAEKGFVDNWIPLENVTTGMIHMRAVWFHLSKDPNDLTPSGTMGQDDVLIETKENLSNALLLITVDSAKSLPRGKKMMSEPSPYVSLTIGNQKKKTLTKPKTTDPRWEESFEFMIRDPREQELVVQVMDSKRRPKKEQVADSKSNKKIGSVNFSLKNLLTAKELTVYRPFHLDGCSPDTKITMRLCLRILTSEKPEAWALESYHLETPEDADESQDSGTNVSEDDKQPQPVEEVVAAETAQTIQAEKHENEKRFIIGDESDAASNASSTLRDRSGTELRHRPQAGSASPYGRIQLTLRYSPNMNTLICSVHKCLNLIPLDEDNLSDPYVNLYLLPERSSTKKKTRIVKNDLNPVFDETFEWNISQSEVSSKMLEVRVRNSVGLLSRNQREMGKVIIDLSKFDNLIKTVTDWYDLGDPEVD